MPVLAAIEAGQLDHLPGGIYARGFLRAYAHEVGCDGEATVRWFGLEAEHAESLPATPHSVTLGLTHVFETHVDVAEIDAMDRRRRLLDAWTLILSLLLIAVYVGFASESAPADPERQVERSTPAPPASKASSPPPQDLLEPAPAAPIADHHGKNEPSSQVRVDVQPLGPCWIAATADGQQVARRLLDRGQDVHIEAREAVVLRIGDAAACGLLINGTTARRLGTSGQAVTLQITPANYREFIGSS
jgi:cytoskeletal protein RodZ